MLVALATVLSYLPTTFIILISLPSHNFYYSYIQLSSFLHSALYYFLIILCFNVECFISVNSFGEGTVFYISVCAPVIIIIFSNPNQGIHLTRNVFVCARAVSEHLRQFGSIHMDIKILKLWCIFSDLSSNGQNV